MASVALARADCAISHETHATKRKWSLWPSLENLHIVNNNKWNAQMCNLIKSSPLVKWEWERVYKLKNCFDFSSRFVCILNCFSTSLRNALFVVDEKTKIYHEYCVCHEKLPSSKWIIVCWHPTYDAIIQATIKFNAHFITCIKSNSCVTEYAKSSDERQHKTNARVWQQHQSILFIPIWLHSDCSVRCCCMRTTSKKCPSFVNADTNIWASVLVRNSFILLCSTHFGRMQRVCMCV